MKRTRIIALLLLLSACLWLTGCAKKGGDDDWSYISGNNKMVVGITLYDPMNFYDANGTLVGFDTEFTEAVCAKLGVSPEFVIIDWDAKETELKSKNIDCIWNGLTVTESRKLDMDFSTSYIKNMQVIIIRADAADRYRDTASLADAVVVAEMGSAGESAVAEDENLSKADYVPLAKQTDALLEVKAGTADAAVLDYVLACSMVGPDTDYSDLMMIPNVELSVEEYAIGFRLGSNVVEKVNTAMQELVADGTLAAMAEKYGLSEQLIFNQ